MNVSSETSVPARATAELLQVELERSFGLDDLLSLSATVLGIEPESIGDVTKKSSFARALTSHFQARGELDTLREALLVAAPAAEEAIQRRFREAAEQPLAAGTQVGAYRIVETIGEGPLARVHLGERLGTMNGHTERVALKVFRPQPGAERPSVLRLLAVIRALEPVRHPGLAGVVDHGKLEDGRAWVAYEMIAGQSLATRIARTGPIHIRELASVLPQALAGLQTLHAAKQVHGNLSTSNFFIIRSATDDDQTRVAQGVLTDAGLLGAINKQPSHPGVIARLVGRAATLAPELALGKTGDARSDVYALGCVLYEALTGRAPYLGESPMEVIAGHLLGDLEPASKHAPTGWIDEALDDLLTRALAREPEARFATARDMSNAIEALQQSSLSAEAVELDEDDLQALVDQLREDIGDDDIAAGIEALVGPARRWAVAADIFTELASEGDDEGDDQPARTQLMLRAARIYQQELRDDTKTEKTYRAILALSPGHATAITALEELYREGEAHENLLDLLLERMESEQEASARGRILREVAALYEEPLEASDNALVAWTQALIEDPTDTRAIAAVERLALDENQWGEVLGTLNESAQENTDSPELAAGIYQRMGRWYADRLQRLDFAVPCFTQALQLVPNYQPAISALCEFYEKSEAWPELVQMLEHRANAASDLTESRNLRTRSASLIAGRLADDARARLILEAVFEEDPCHEAAFDELAALLERQQDLQALVKAHDTRAGQQRGEERATTLGSLGELQEQQLGDLDLARKAFEGALEHDASHLVSLKGLERIHARNEDHAQLAEVLEQQLELDQTPAQRNVLLERLGGLLEEGLDDLEGATARFEAIIELAPGHENANRALARLYRGLHRFEDLVETLDRHAKSVEDPERKIDLLLQAARVLLGDLGAPTRARVFSERILGLQPEHLEALELNARLNTLTGDGSAAVEAVEVLASTETDTTKKASLWTRAADMLAESGNLEDAIERYRNALDADPDNTTAQRALNDLFARRGDTQGRNEMLMREIERTTDTARKVELLIDLGQLQIDDLNRPAEAKASFELALELEPGSSDAAIALGIMASEDGRDAATVQHLEALLPTLQDLPTEQAVDLTRRCARSLVALGHKERALAAFDAALALDPDQLEATCAIAELAMDLGDHERAARTLSEMLQDHAEQLTSSERGTAWLDLGLAQEASGALSEATEAYIAASDQLPESAEPVDALARVQRTVEDWEGLVLTLRRRIDLSSNDQERFELLVQQGDLFGDKLKDRVKASRAYVAAIELRDDDRNVLAKLMQVYSEDKNWPRLLDVLARLSKVVGDDSLKIRYLQTAATIALTELEDHEKAASYYEQALAIEPAQSRLQQKLEECLVALEDWAKLEGMLRERLEKLPEDAQQDQGPALCDKLADILIDKLGRRDDGIALLQRALEFEPEQRERLEKLVQLYAQSPLEYAGQIVQAHSLLIDQNPYRVESYKTLSSLYQELGKVDERWCMCQALHGLSMAEAEELDFFRQLRSDSPAPAQECFDEDIWDQVMIHPNQDDLLTSIFSFTTLAALATHARPLEELGVDPRQQIADPSQEANTMAQMLHYAAGVSLMPLPALYYHPQDHGGLSMALSNPPGVLLGQAAIQGANDQALAFIAARQLSYFRPGHFMRQLVPTGSGLRAWLLAAIRITNARFPIPDQLEDKITSHCTALRQHLSAPQVEQLQSLVEHLLETAPELDMKRWVAAVDLTADRVGFVLSDSLDAATAVVRASAQDANGASERERLQSLFSFAVSPTYLQLRKTLGIQKG